MGAVVPITSRPSLARPSTTLPQSAPPVMDGRHKHALGRTAGPARGAGHDDERTTLAPNPSPAVALYAYHYSPGCGGAIVGPAMCGGSHGYSARSLTVKSQAISSAATAKTTSPGSRSHCHTSVPL